MRYTNRADREHLIVELKRPKAKIDRKAADQIRDYADAIAEDERFKDTNTRWVFWVVSNEIADSVRRDTRQRDRPEGMLHDVRRSAANDLGQNMEPNT